MTFRANTRSNGIEDIRGENPSPDSSTDDNPMTAISEADGWLHTKRLFITGNFTIAGHSVTRSDIRAISRNSEGSFIVYLADMTELKVSARELESQVPYDLRVDLNILRTLPHPTAKRHSKTQIQLKRRKR